VSGRVVGDGGKGIITLRFHHEAVEGDFELEGQRGRLKAVQSKQDAASFFKGPDQKLDITENQWRQDLDHLVEILTTRHGSPFHRTSKLVFQREAERIRSALPRMSGPDIALELVKLASLIGDGHTFVAYPRGRPRFNLETYWFEDGIRAVAAEPAHKDMLGALIVSIDDVPISEALRRLRVFAAQGETDWSYRSVAPYLLGSVEMLRMVGIGKGDVSHFKFKTLDGKTQRIPLRAAAVRPDRLLLGGGRPIWYRGDEAFRTERLRDGSIYVNWRGYDDLAGRTASLMAEVDRERPRRLIIDLRDNGGGDYNQGRQFIALITAREWLNRPDVLFVLIGRQTFSAAMTNAVDFRTGTRATLIGEPPGAAPNGWQEVRKFHLPNSGLAVGVSTRYYEFLQGKDALRPDIHLPPRPGDWGAPYDAAVLSILSSTSGSAETSR
jgi:hypothetical protein